MSRENVAALQDAYANLNRAYDALYAELAAEREKVREACELSELSILMLNDWLHQYTPENCNDDDVTRTRSHIKHRGGTIGYITKGLERHCAFLTANKPREAPVESEAD